MAIEISLGNVPKLVTTAVESSHAVALIAAKTAMTMNSRIAPTFRNCRFSTVL